MKVHWKPAAVEAARTSLNSAVGLSSGAKMDSGASKFNPSTTGLENILKIKFLANKPTGAVLDLKKDDQARSYLQGCLQIASFLYELTTSIRIQTDDATDSKTLKYQTAVISRIQNTQKYVLADIKAISDASATAAGKVTGKFADVQEKTKALNEKINETKKSAPK